MRLGLCRFFWPMNRLREVVEHPELVGRWGLTGLAFWVAAALPALPRTGVVLWIRVALALLGLALSGSAVLLSILTLRLRQRR